MILASLKVETDDVKPWVLAPDVAHRAVWRLV